MAGLLEPYVPDFGKWAQSATQGYALGDTMRNRDVSVSAGALAARGNLKGARNAFYQGGNFDDAGKIDARLRADAQAAKTESLEKAAKFQSMLGNLAMAADTPEKWAAAIGTAQKMGLDVRKYADFGARDVVLAQTGKVSDMLKMELERRKEDREAAKPIEVGGRLVRPRADGSGYEEVYAAPPKAEGLMQVSPGTTVLDPATRQPVYTAPEKPQPAYDFTATGAGNKFTGDFKPYTQSPDLRPPLQATDRKEIIASDAAARTARAGQGTIKEAINLNDKAYSGWAPSTRAFFGSMVGLEGAKATQNLDNLLLGQSLEQLKTFLTGVATDTDLKLVRELQGAMSQPPAVRKDIFDRAQRRLRELELSENEQARALRSREYYTPEYAPPNFADQVDREMPRDKTRIDLDKGTQQPGSKADPLGILD